MSFGKHWLLPKLNIEFSTFVGIWAEAGIACHAPFSPFTFLLNYSKSTPNPYHHDA
ncbi:hypothetical protein ACFSKU_02795 [Pontibacter silvestris]|uniref:Uncharacterized protein n=1 Tax=Pontibacter silvestris TaxID=2305183 RepID=A0ABW4WV05_9BACT|nr:hypothetical protein [Pontibacter silvestris]MCC9138405.1 hypothetical protein [Pontibacter silvestris]